MYFSKRSKEIVYINHYSGLLEVEGKGPLFREDSEVWPASENWQDDFDVLSVTEGITSLEEGYLEAFPNVDCLILSRTVTAAVVSEELEKRFRKRKVLIRGEYDTFAEEFAREKKLKFLHCDIPLATDVDETHKETDIITLRFHVKGAPDVHHNVFTPGSSAGSYGGGEYASELPRDFYSGLTVEGFAEKFPERIREQLLDNGMLRRFLEAANRRVLKKKK